MKNKILGKLSLSIVACAVLAACGSDDKDELPTVSVAASVSLKENRTTTIAATAADDDEIVSYSWTQVSGPTLVLANATASTVGVTAPAVTANGAAVLRVTVTDSGEQTASADVTINIANNVLPTVTSTFEAAAEKSAVTLTAVAADTDGTVSSYSWTQTAGTPVTLTGANTATLSFTAPNVTAATELAFSVTVSDDDNETASVAGVVTVTPVVNTFTVSGTVSDTAFANAEVSGILAGQTFSTTADASGVFSLPLQADDDETNLFANVTASSVTTAGLEFYKFVPALVADPEPAIPTVTDSLSSALSRLLNVKPAAEGDPNEISVNAVSTALYALIVSANGGTAPDNLDSFTLVEKAISPDELIEAAAVVQLIVQGGAFALPEGVTDVLELLTNTEAYNDYVEAAEVESPGIIAETIIDIIADPELTPPVDETSLASTYFEVYPAAGGFLSRGGSRYNFNEDGSGTETAAGGVDAFEWELTDGIIQVDYIDALGQISFPSVRVGLAGLTQEQVTLLQNAGFNQIEVRFAPQRASMQRIIEGEKTDTYRITNTFIQTMTPITLQDGTVISTNGVTFDSTTDQLLRNADKITDIAFTEAELTGDWAFEHYYYAGEEGLGYASMFADLFRMSADGTGIALESNKTFSWQLNDDKALVVTFEDGTSTEVIKLDQLGTDLQLFYISYDAEGNVIAADGDYGLKLDGSDFGTYDLSTPEDMYWQTTINQWRKDSWNGNTLLWDDGFAYFGWQLLEEGDGYQMVRYSSSPPDFTPVFDSPLTWQQAAVEDIGTVVSINRFLCFDDATQVCGVRDWLLLKAVDGNIGQRMYVFEVEDRRNNSTSPWFIAPGLGPRINIYEEIRFDYWNETAATGTDASTTSASSRVGTSAARKLFEPNLRASSGL